MKFLPEFLKLLADCLNSFATGSGDRTFGVLTKLDLMDKGTNALDVRLLSFSQFLRNYFKMLYSI